MFYTYFVHLKLLLAMVIFTTDFILFDDQSQKYIKRRTIITVYYE